MRREPRPPAAADRPLAERLDRLLVGPVERHHLLGDVAHVGRLEVAAGGEGAVQAADDDLLDLGAGEVIAGRRERADVVLRGIAAAAAEVHGEDGAARAGVVPMDASSAAWSAADAVKERETVARRQPKARRDRRRMTSKRSAPAGLTPVRLCPGAAERRAPQVRRGNEAALRKAAAFTLCRVQVLLLTRKKRVRAVARGGRRGAFRPQD